MKKKKKECANVEWPSCANCAHWTEYKRIHGTGKCRLPDGCSATDGMDKCDAWKIAIKERNH